MSSSNKIKELTVLCPNGRRVNIKTSPSTSIGQIIEEACLKHEFDPYSYNMKFLHRTLDPSSTLQYSNIPNRAQVELIKASVRREEGSVTVNLVTEKGQRLIADFPSSTSLWDILLYHENQQESNFCIPAASSGFQPFIVYTMQRIIGEDLKTTTLKSLGLYSGKCMMRYNVQKIADIESSPIVIVSPKTIMKTIQASKASGAQESQNEVKCVEKNVEVDLPQKATTEPVESTVEEMECDSLSEKEPTVHLPAESPEPQRLVETRVDSSVMENIENQDDVMKEAQPLRNSNSESSGHQIDPRLEEDKPAPKIIPLSDHNSVLFSLDDAPSAAHIQESEEFFELTLSEVRRLYRDKVKELREMEEAPLMTTDMRQLERDSRMLSAINRHPVTHLRICFPDRHVIQANFKPHNTIKDVKEFLSPLLIRSDLNFDLYTLFPRRVLDPSLNLVDAGCIPNARLYFSADGEEVSFLSKETISKKSSFEAAANAVRTTSRQSSNLGQDLEDPSTSSFEAPRPTPSPNTVEQSSAGAVSRIRSTDNQNVPKWFKLGK